MPTYNVAGNWDHMDTETRVRLIASASDSDLVKWASDPDCNQRSLCAQALAKRQGKKDEETAKRREELRTNPFDARTEISADARYIAKQIVKHLWIIFVALPIVLAVLFEILK
jgi:hypothetical protein